MTTRETAMRVIEEHKQIVAAIARRDSAGAEQLMRSHIAGAPGVVESVETNSPEHEHAATTQKRSTRDQKKSPRPAKRRSSTRS
jgi:hypothetical protein